MKQNELLHRQQQILSNLSRLPRKILHMQGNDNIAELVMHELCNEDCFNLEKAAYFIDNPDFNCLKGLAGFARSEAYPARQKMWDEPQKFMQYMQAASFNNKVRSYYRNSFTKQGQSEQEAAKYIAQDLGLEEYGHLSWHMKHDNHGLFIYQKVCADDTCADDYILDGLSLLGFCPIY